MRGLKTEHWLLIVGFTVLIVGSLLILSPATGMKDPEDALQGSTFYTSPSGGKAVYMILRDVGLPAKRLERRLTLTPADTKVLIFASLNPASRVAFALDEIDWLGNWVNEGGTVVWIPRRGHAGRPIGDSVSAFFQWTIEGAGMETEQPVQGTLDALGGLPAYEVTMNPDWYLVPDQEDRTYDVLVQDDGFPLVISEEIGQGRFIAVADPVIFGNKSVGDADNILFLTHLLALAADDGVIRFDEYHHGFTGSQNMWGVIFDTPAGAAVIQVLLLLLFLAYAAGRRIGPAIDVHREKRRRPAEFIEAFANFCARRGARGTAITILYEQLRQEAVARAGKADGAAIARLTGDDPEKVDRILREARGGAKDARSFSRLAAEMETLRRAMHRRPT